MSKLDLTTVLSLTDLQKARKKLYSREARRKNPYKEMFHPPVGKTQKNKFFKIDEDSIYERCRAFEFKKYRGVAIPKGGGKKRPLLIPEPEDRIVLSAIYPKIVDIIARKINKENELFGVGKIFSERDIPDIILNVNENLHADGYKQVVKIDFSNFFSTIDRRNLLQILQQQYFNMEKKQENVLFYFIKQSLYNEIESDKTFFQGDIRKMNLREIGIPQGLPYSPLLANIYALEIDQEVKKIEDCIAIRYIDDMVILSKDAKSRRKAFTKLKRLTKKKGLVINGLKTKQINFNKKGHVVFLGIGLTNTGELLLPEKKTVNVRKKLDEIRNSAHLLEKYINNLYYTNYFERNDVAYILNKKIGSSIDGIEQYYKSFGLQNYSEVMNEFKRDFLLN